MINAHLLKNDRVTGLDGTALSRASKKVDTKGAQTNLGVEGELAASTMVIGRSCKFFAHRSILIGQISG